MSAIRDEIDRALAVLNLGPDECRALSDREGHTIYEELAARCVVGPPRRWWWEALAQPHATYAVSDQQGFARLSVIAPDPSERVWFIADLDDGYGYCLVLGLRARLTFGLPPDGVSIVAQLSLLGFFKYSVSLARDYDGERREISRGHFFNIGGGEILELGRREGQSPET